MNTINVFQRFIQNTERPPTAEHALHHSLQQQRGGQIALPEPDFGADVAEGVQGLDAQDSVAWRGAQQQEPGGSKLKENYSLYFIVLKKCTVDENEILIS